MNLQLNRVSPWISLLARFVRERPLGAAAGAVILITAFLAAFGPWVRPFDPVEIHYDDTFQKPNWTYLMGTDNFGRDVFSRLITAARPVFVVALSSVALGSVVGGLIGIASAYRGGWLDSIVQRVMDGVMAIPILVLALTIAAMFGPEDRNVVAALALINVPIANRILRSAALSVHGRAVRRGRQGGRRERPALDSPSHHAKRGCAVLGLCDRPGRLGHHRLVRLGVPWRRIAAAGAVVGWDALGGFPSVCGAGPVARCRPGLFHRRHRVRVQHPRRRASVMSSTRACA